VNVRGLLITIREAIPHLSKSGGAVVNISSTLAQASMPGAAAYSGAKAAVERITSALAVELGPQGIRLNSVAPANPRISPKRWPDALGILPNRRSEGCRRRHL
jgi:NAD(P)-dependent dehydrogenase (short-subunit alcohol dehydrogenase family)